MSDQARPPTHVSVHDLPATGTDEDGGSYTRVGRAAGSQHLGCTLEVIAPGGSPASYHYHAGNEEAMYVLSGTGTLRTPDGTHPIREGDYAAFPRNESGAHAVENDGEEPLRCLFVSTMNHPDVAVYPDEGTMVVTTGGPPGSDEARSVEVSPVGK